MEETRLDDTMAERQARRFFFFFNPPGPSRWRLRGGEREREKTGGPGVVRGRMCGRVRVVVCVCVCVCAESLGVWLELASLPGTNSARNGADWFSD